MGLSMCACHIEEDVNWIHYCPMHRAAAETLDALEHLLASVKDPVEESQGFDHPPEYATAEDANLARAIFDGRTAVAKAKGIAG